MMVNGNNLVGENITITEVLNDSDNNQTNYTIHFVYEPNIYLEPIIELSDGDTKVISYNVLIGGDEDFTHGLLQ